MTRRRAVVIGGGLAGISASVGLADAGFEVTLLEARPRLGGSATSYRRGAITIDNGQHVFLRCCDSYLGLLDRLGASEAVTIQERFDVTVLSERGQARLRRTNWPSPLHLAPALARYRMLPLPDRIRVGRAAVGMRFLDPSVPSADRVRLGDWLAARGQNERTRRLLWDLFIISALNIGGDDANLSLAATVIKTGLLADRTAADIGVAQVPLGDLHDTAAARLLAELGVKVTFGAKVADVRPLADGGFAVGLVPGRGTTERDRSGQGTAAHAAVTRADGVVLAVPPSQAASLAGPAGVPGAGRWGALGASPIVNVHVIYDRPVTSLRFAAAVDSPVQWIFDKTRTARLSAGQYLAVSLSAADAYVNEPASRLRARFVPALERLLPAASAATITDFFVTRERRATFRQAPGCAALRPGTRTYVPGLVLAGSWTDTGWPDTMEGAVRSGQSAARELTEQLTSGRAEDLLVPPATRDTTEPPGGRRRPSGPAAAAARTGAAS